jgi:uncharacterized protein
VPTPFAMVTGAGTRAGLELAHIAAISGYDLLIADDNAKVYDVAGRLRDHGGRVDAIETDLSTPAGVDQLMAVASRRKLDIVCVIAGQGQRTLTTGGDVDWRAEANAHIVGLANLLQKIICEMVLQQAGQVLVIGTPADAEDTEGQELYTFTKTFIDRFTLALRDELKQEMGITVTSLMPDAAEVKDFGRTLDDVAVRVAQAGWDAMMKASRQSLPVVDAAFLSAIARTG